MIGALYPNTSTAAPSVPGITRGRSVEETEIFALLQSMERLRLDGEGVWEAQTNSAVRGVAQGNMHSLSISIYTPYLVHLW